MKRFFSFLVFIVLSFHHPLRAQGSRLVYDLGVSSGTRNNEGYSEVNLGLSWYLLENWAWRNSVFGRFGSKVDSTGGLDSSIRYVYNSDRDERGFGLGFFAGPGYRFSNQENSGVFGEAGVALKAGGVAFGVGLKAISYNSPGQDSNGDDLPKTDTVTFLILGVDGAF